MTKRMIAIVAHPESRWIVQGASKIADFLASTVRYEYVSSHFPGVLDVC